MTENQKRLIVEMLAHGSSYREIGEYLNIKRNTIKTFCWRHGFSPADTNTPQENPQPAVTKKKSGKKLKAPQNPFCINCNKLLEPSRSRSDKKFCSNKCRTDWWNKHPREIACVCGRCDKEFIAKQRKQRFCSNECATRFIGEERLRKSERRCHTTQEKETHELYGTKNDLQFIVITALRYALGRKSYATHLVPEFIKDNLSIFNQEWLVNLLNDIKWYEDDRENGLCADDDSDYRSWISFRDVVRDEYKNRNFPNPRRFNMVDSDWMDE